MNLVDLKLRDLKLGDLATARSGDKGNHANIVVAARSPQAFHWLQDNLTAEQVAGFFAGLEPTRVERFVVPSVEALNFVLYDVLNGGGSLSLRSDTQGKLLGTAILDLPCPSAPRTN